MVDACRLSDIGFRGTGIGFRWVGWGGWSPTDFAPPRTAVHTLHHPALLHTLCITPHCCTHLAHPPAHPHRLRAHVRRGAAHASARRFLAPPAFAALVQRRGIRGGWLHVANRVAVKLRYPCHAIPSLLTSYSGRAGRPKITNLARHWPPRPVTWR